MSSSEKQDKVAPWIMGLILLIVCALAFSWAWSKPATDMIIPQMGAQLSTVKGISIRRVPRSNSSSSTVQPGANGSGMRISKGDSLQEMVGIIYEIPVGGIQYDFRPLPHGIQFALQVGTKDKLIANFQAQFRTAVEGAFSIRSEQVVQLMPVLLLQCPSGSSLMKPESTSNGGVSTTRSSSLSTSASFKGNMDELCRWLSRQLGKPVLNQTKLVGNFSHEFFWKSSKGNTLEDVLLALGLATVPEDRELKVLKVSYDPAADPARHTEK